MKKKILILGGSSVIGFKLLKYCINNQFNVEYTYFRNQFSINNKGFCLDITNKETIQNIISKIKPNIVIHAAALTNVDLCETDHTLADRINVDGTNNIIDACKKINSKIVYISSSYVFNGNRNEFFEYDKTFPSNYYGITKAKAEKLIQNSGLDHLILRTDQPYCWMESWQRVNSVIRVIRAMKSHEIFREITDWYSNPTYVPNFVEATIRLIDSNLSGIYHIVGRDFISRYQWSLLVCDVFKLNKKLLVPITSDFLKLPAKRYNIKLNCDKIFKDTHVKMIGVKNGLIQMLQDNKDYSTSLL